jgi:hypothetical protein
MESVFYVSLHAEIGVLVCIVNSVFGTYVQIMILNILSEIFALEEL